MAIEHNIAGMIQKLDPGILLSDLMYREAQAAGGQLGTALSAAYQITDEIQRQAVGFVWNSVFHPRFDPRYWAALASEVSLQAKEILQLAESPNQRSLTAAQIRNTLYVYNLVLHASQSLQEPPSGRLPLTQLIETAYSLGDYPVIWLVEGLGHDYAARVWDGTPTYRDLLSSGEASALPPRTLTMMHAGLGLCFAQKLLNRLTPGSDDAAVHRVLETYLTLCRNNSRPGYAGCAFESLGLVTRVFYPRLMRMVAAGMERIGTEAIEFFWHGVGRGLYFLPAHLVQPIYSPWIVVEQEVPEGFARRNARAGMSWGNFLCNMRNPEIIASQIARRGTVERDGAFQNGVASCLAMASDILPGNPVIRTFLQYQPSQCCGGPSGDWQRLVRGPAIDGVQRYQPALAKAGKMDEAFRFHDDAFVKGGIS